MASTWRDEAPSVRSIPNSRVRWATVIENVLKIRKAPTKTEMPAKTSRKVVRKPKPSLMSAGLLGGVLGPGLRLGRPRQDRVERASRARSGVTPSAASTSMLSSSPSLPVIACASGSVKSAKLAPPSGTPGAEPADPRERVLLGAADAADRDLLADLVALLVGGDRVDADLVGGRRGGALDPGERVERLRLDALRRSAAGRRRPARSGRRSRRGSRSRSSRRSRPAAFSTPSTAATLSTSDSRQRRARLGQVEAAVEGRLRLDRDVDAGVGLGEDVVEGLVDRPLQHEGAGDHRDAEHDRERGQRRAQLPGRQPAKCEAEHLEVPHQADDVVLALDLPVGGDLAVGEDDDAVGVGGDLRVVGDDDDGLAELVDRRPQQVEDAVARLRVEVAGRLVGEDDGGPGDQRAGDRDPLLLAAGELGGPVGGAVGEADGLEQLVAPGRVDVAAGDPQRQLDVLGGVEDRARG